MEHGRFGLEGVKSAPADPLYALARGYREDTSENKIDLVIGAYRDDEGKPWVLPVVKKARKIILENSDLNHEYLPIQGLESFLSGARRLLLGSDLEALLEKRICSLQTVSGTGAVHLGATFLSRFRARPVRVLISDPSWPNHEQIFGQLDYEITKYRYYSKERGTIDIDGFISSLQAAARGSIVVLQACAHNPTGLDPSIEDWERIATVMADRGHFPFFDCAYQGFASGDLEKDSWAIRFFVQQGFECCIAQSFAKNLGLYGERVGAFHFVCAPGPQAEESVKAIASQLALIQRAEISNPPVFGSRIASTILNDPDLFEEWEVDLNVMSKRLSDMRNMIQAQFQLQNTPGSWGSLSEQKGMFSFLPLSATQIKRLREEWHIYMTSNGRISVAGLNTKNLAYFVQAVDSVKEADVDIQ